MLNIILFASSSESIGKKQLAVPFMPTPEALVNAVPVLLPLKGHPEYRVAVNQVWANWSTPLKDGDEIAILPPVSGG